MKIKVKVCTEKHIVEARTIVLDTEEYPRLQEMIDNGELKDISTEVNTLRAEGSGD